MLSGGRKARERGGFGRGSSGGTIRRRVRNDDGGDGAFDAGRRAAGVLVRVSEMSIPVGNADSGYG
jgi:hypothetical protein